MGTTARTTTTETTTTETTTTTTKALLEKFDEGDTLELCHKRCRENSECYSFAIHQKTRKCVLNRENCVKKPHSAFHIFNMDSCRYQKRRGGKFDRFSVQIYPDYDMGSGEEEEE